MSAPRNKMLNWKVKKCTVGFIYTPALRISRRLMLKFGKMTNIYWWVIKHRDREGNDLLVWTDAVSVSSI